MSIVIIYGPKGCGKTTNQFRFKKHYQCRSIHDDWDGISPLREGTLALTTQHPPFDLKGAKSVSFKQAMREAA